MPPAKTLSPEQVTQYYKEQQNVALPLSPLDWLSKQPPIAPATSTTTTPASTIPTSTSTTTPTTPVPLTGTSNGTTGTDPGSPTLSDQTDRTALTQAQSDLQTASKKFQDTITGVQNGSIPLNAGEQAQVDALNGQYQKLIDDQKEQNDRTVRSQNMLDFREGRTQYMPMEHIETINEITEEGAAKVMALAVQQAGKVAELTQALKDKDIKTIKDAYDALTVANKDRQDALKETIKETQTAIDKANAAKIAAAKVQYDEVTKPIQDLAQIAKNNGAPSNVMAKIGSATSLDAAYQAAGNYASQGTGIVAEYNYAKANGYSGSISQYQADQENMKAMAKARAEAATNPVLGIPGLDDVPPAGLGGDKSGGSILKATGLSYWAYKALTEGSTALARFSEKDRVLIGNEIKRWADRNDIDISTFKSQFSAYNDVVQSNVNRANQTRIMSGEVSGTADSLIQAIEERGGVSQKSAFGGNVPSTYTKDNMSTVRAVNIMDLMAGKETNNTFAQTYSTQIKLMANDLAGYLAAARGSKAGPELTDQKDAANIIANGMNKGSTEAFKNAIVANEQKVNKVVNDNIISTQKQVWDLFGVGDQYKTPTSNSDAVLKEHKDAGTYGAFSMPGSDVGSSYNGFTLPH